MLRPKLTCAPLLILSLCGCAELTHFNWNRRIPTESAARQIYVDAKQRVVISAPVQTLMTSRSADGLETTTTQTSLRFCAEPSPDALSALAASGGGDLSAEDRLTLGAAFSLSEGAASIGLRTQTIQMLRDAMYRICEASVSGMLSPAQFETLHRRFQSSMVAILAIEQLTGAVHGPVASISGRSSYGNAELIASLTEQVTAARTAAESAKTDADAKSSASTQAAGKPAELLQLRGKTSRDELEEADKAEYDRLVSAAADAKTAAENASATSASRQEELANYEAALVSARSGQLDSSTSASSRPGTARTLDAATVAKLAEEVRGIVRDTYGLGYFREICATLFVAQIEGRAGIADTDGIAAKCLEFADQTIALARVGTIVAASQVGQANEVSFDLSDWEDRFFSLELEDGETFAPKAREGE